MATNLVENDVELASLDWLQQLGYATIFGPHLGVGEASAERTSFSEVLLAGRFRAALRKLNPTLPAEALDEAFRKVIVPQQTGLVANNRAFHRMLVDGIAVECRREDESIGAEIVRLVDFNDPEANDWLAVNQFTVIEGQHNRRPDVVVFVNGLPLGLLELKNAADENADIWAAFNQVQTYKHHTPSIFHHNALIVISDGVEARIGTISSDRERFMPWRTIAGETIAPAALSQVEVLLRGVFEKQRFLDLVRHFIVFEDDGGTSVIKKMAGYHQFHAVNTAIAETVRATGGEMALRELGRGYFAKPQAGGAPGDKRVGVVWHTQGSGKSLTMAFYAGRLVVHPAMENPTLVVLTDRNDLDDQLFGTFSRCHELLRQKPQQANSREHLRELLKVASGGVIFTTIHKFFPEEKGGRHPTLSERRNIVVIADEAHRSQYDFIDGFARHMRDALPNASFIGFTGTPIEKSDANTRSVFGDYISIYDIQRAVEDKATVPIYYEGRLAKLELKPEERPKIDPNFEEATEGEELDHKEKLKTKWAALEAVVGSEKRIGLVAKDFVKHWEARLEVIDGKAMIVCMSRRICYELYEAIRKLRPEWHHKDDDKGAMKIVMTGSASDPLEWQDHIRNKPRREALAKRFKNPQDPLKIVLVRDMWLTGFDAPSLHTMYVDKPMRSHGLMQAIARVNRVFKDKPGGLVVDYLGLAQELKEALAVYTESGGHGETAMDQEEAVAVMLEKYEVCCDFFHGFDWSKWTSGNAAQKLSLLPAAQEHLLAKAAKEKKPEEHKQKFMQAVTDLSKAFALAVPHEKAIEIRDDVGFFQAVRAVLAKGDGDRRKSADDIDHAIRQIISRAVASDEVVDIFAAAGLKRPDISILSDEFLADVRELPHKNLAVETLRKLLQNEIRIRSRKFLIQSRSFSEMLEASIRKYQNRAIETAAVIEELIALAKQMREAARRGEELGLAEDELAFYDALEVNDSAVKVLGDENLRFIARELLKTIRENVTIDWTAKESVRAKLRVMVKRILRKYGYPPDKQEKATQTVLQQAELLCAEWGASDQ
ncbi:MAG: type I restriction endonuclease subunit R [Verrucomicrobia subdivision 3 bacterium]|nr:type I restriction endonuclease subunit R [Limisphaerales bacterium]